ncbi:hypothetical protein LEP1GSC186_3802 [Leptospira noguchii serovar Autumnalis str. ZUN142]|uniref:Uncharacterized protein n=1 Tax=Leptospira noguchii serovar Autumnalis str. ZUN142 TaxID=1085540 RepID=M6UR18_9LEPT|nr:hypothetical protein LEP1GSC186_3802 [Leptospira noguchii serovar Autumnalis str. ZUN142]
MGTHIRIENFFPIFLQRTLYKNLDSTVGTTAQHFTEKFLLDQST